MDDQRFQHAIALRDSGRLEEAICELRALRDSAPDLFEKAIIRINEFNCLLRLNKAGEAEEILADLRGSLEPSSPLRLDLDFCEIGLLMLRQQNEQGLKALDNILERHARQLKTPERQYLFEDIQVRRGRLLAERNRFSEALPLLEAARAYEMDDAGMGDVYYCLGVCRHELGNEEGGELMFLEALRLGTRTYHPSRSHYYLGITYYHRGDYVTAKREFEQCDLGAAEAKLAPANVYGWLADTCYALGLKKETALYESLSKVQ